MILPMLGSLAGGIGLFMLGMQLMTEGLKLASGSSLRDILERSTSTPLRGLFSGAFITSLVQSSSAVTVATIGFVNAGLMTLRQAVTVIYGSNIGTTATGWLIALVGFQLNIKVFALPAIGIGMLLRLVGNTEKQGAIGEVLAGFGVFFIGVDVLKTTFSGLGQGLDLAGLGGGGFLSLVLFLGIGFLLTFLMQSSSGAMAVALTATAGGIIPLDNAAAVVIGANVGTTSTAALAVLGATPNAKRAAGAHVVFNLITGLVAVLLLPLLLKMLAAANQSLGRETLPTTLLAMFHTTFNVLGVILLWPVTRRMVRWLNKRFRSAEENEASPLYLDRNVVGTPILAVHALAKELARIGAIARRMAKGAMSSESGPSRQLEKDKAVLLQLEAAVGEFTNHLQRGNLPPELDDVLPNALRVSGYYTEVAEVAVGIAGAQRNGRTVTHTELANEIGRFKSEVIKLLKAADVEAEGFSEEECAAILESLEDEYKTLKAGLLRAGTKGEIPVSQMVFELELLSHIRRIVEQAEKGARYLWNLTAVADADEMDEDNEREAHVA